MSENSGNDPKVNTYLSEFFPKLGKGSKKPVAEDTPFKTSEKEKGSTYPSGTPNGSTVGIVSIFSNRRKVLSVFLVIILLLLFFILWNQKQEVTEVSHQAQESSLSTKNNLVRQADIQHQKELLQLKERELELKAREIALEATRVQALESRMSHGFTEKTVMNVSGTNNCEEKSPSHLDLSTRSLKVTGRTCTIVIFSGRSSGVKGKWYQLAVPDPTIPGNFYKCGDAGGQNDSEATCADFATRYSGREIKVAVLDGGYLFIK